MRVAYLSRYQSDQIQPTQSCQSTPIHTEQPSPDSPRSSRQDYGTIKQLHKVRFQASRVSVIGTKASSSLKARVKKILPPLYLISSLVLFILAITKDFGFRGNALVTLGLGYSSQSIFQILAKKETLRREKTVITDYFGEYYITITTIALNLPTSHNMLRFVYGLLITALGTQFASNSHTIANRLPEEMHTAHVVDQKEPKIQLLFGNTTKERILGQIPRLLAATAFMIAGAVQSMSVLSGIGHLFLGQIAGEMLYELFHQIKLKKEQKHHALRDPNAEDFLLANLTEPQVPASLRFMRISEEKVYFMLLTLPGSFIAKKLPMTDFLAGVFVGILYAIKKMRLIKTNPSKLHELKFRVISPQQPWQKCLSIVKRIYAIGAVGTFLIAASILDGGPSRAALLPAAGILYAGYAFSRLIDRYDILQEGTSASPSRKTFTGKFLCFPYRFSLSIKFLNQCFLFFRYHVPLPILYILIIQALKIDDNSLDHSPITQELLSVTAYSFLALSLTTYAAERNTERNRPAPPNPTPFLSLGLDLLGRLLLKEQA